MVSTMLIDNRKNNVPRGTNVLLISRFRDDLRSDIVVGQ